MIDSLISILSSIHPFIHPDKRNCATATRRSFGASYALRPIHFICYASYHDSSARGQESRLFPRAFGPTTSLPNFSWDVVRRRLVSSSIVRSPN